MERDILAAIADVHNGFHALADKLDSRHREMVAEFGKLHATMNSAFGTALADATTAQADILARLQRIQGQLEQVEKRQTGN